MLTPADIDTKQFSTTRIKEGYVQEEVDDFLDRVQEDFAFLTQQVARLENENATLRRITKPSEAPTAVLPPVAEPPSFVAQKLLEAAERAAQEHEAEARSKADGIVREAGGEAARLVEEAHTAAERIKSEGLAEKYRRNEELEKKVERLNSDVEDLNDRARRVRQALADALNSVGSVT
jgi:DivIVA domain-containing protein